MKNLPILLSLLLLSCCSSRTVDAKSVTDCHCTPSVRQVSEEILRADMDIWTLYLRVALVGCEEDLSTLTEEQLEELQAEFLDPQEWSNVNLIATHQKAELRTKATRRVNEILGDELVSTVLFHDLRLIDHSG